jgi:hypothetical protein
VPLAEICAAFFLQTKNPQEPFEPEADHAAGGSHGSSVRFFRPHGSPQVSLFL